MPLFYLNSGALELFLSWVHELWSFIFLIRQILPAVEARWYETTAIMRDALEARVAGAIVTHIRRVTCRTTRLHFET